MARPSRFKLRLQSLVLLVLIPGLLLSTALLGWSTYRSVYGIIMEGFDQKLYAVSTVTGSFIRGEDHEELFAARQIVALAGNAATPEPLGIDSASGRLVRLDAEVGGALDVGELPGDTRAIAAGSAPGQIWIATAEPAELRRLDLTTGRDVRVGPLAVVPLGLAYDARRGVLYGGGDRLTAIDPGTGAQRPMNIEGLTGPVRTPTLGAGDTLFLLAGQPEQLVAVDLGRATAHPVGALHYAEPAGGESTAPAAGSGPPPVLRALAYARDGLLGVTNRLVRIDRNDATVDSAGTAPGFRSYRHPLYARYVGPMERIMAKKDISYLYTEMVGMGGVLTYGIDATGGDDHSVIGSTEAIADDEIPGMERAMVDGQVRLSDIENWGAWGLLKTADAPIYRDDGRIAALAGADIDISLILDRTRVALVKVGIVAALTLLLGAFVSVFISRRLVSPLTEVKEGALQLAAGEYGHRIADQQLLELGELGDSFNNMSAALAATIEELTRTNLALETVRRGRALEVALADPGHQYEPGLPFVIEHSPAGDGRLHNPSGYAHIPASGGDRIVLWIADPIPERPLDNLRLRREIAALAGPMVARHPHDWEAAAVFLTILFPRLHGLVLLDGAARTVHARVKRPILMAVVSADGSIREVDLAVTREYSLAPTEWVAIAAQDARAAVEAIRHRPAQPPLPQMAVALLGRDLPLAARESPDQPSSALAAVAEAFAG